MIEFFFMTENARLNGRADNLISCYSDGLRVIKRQLAARVNGTSWGVKVPVSPPRIEIEVHEQSYDSIITHARDNYDPSFHRNGQNPKHLRAMLLILGNWGSIVKYLNPHSSGNPRFDEVFCFPEVVFKNPKVPNRSFSIDCLGTDKTGSLYIIEIGKNGKDQQLGTEINNLKLLYPALHFTGILAYYKINRRETAASLDLNILNGH